MEAEGRAMKRLLSELQFTLQAILGGLPGLLLLAIFVLLGLLGWETKR